MTQKDASSKHILIIGYGSIGKRHYEVALSSGHKTSLVSRRPLSLPDCFATVEEALAKSQPDLIVICNETAAHTITLQELVEHGYGGAVLVEKPLAQPTDLPIDIAAMRVSVAYVLRFHPTLQALADRLAGETIVSADLRCGSYLPDWRPNQDYRQTESASLEAGGGVLRDLSHELDTALWLLGPWKTLSAVNGRFSSLEIATDDTCLILGQTERCSAVTISLNYLDRPAERRVRVNTYAGTYTADLLANTLQFNTEELETFEPFDRNLAFARQHKDAMREAPEILTSLKEAETTLNTIEAVEKSANQQIWIKP